MLQKQESQYGAEAEQTRDNIKEVREVKAGGGAVPERKDLVNLWED